MKRAFIAMWLVLIITSSPVWAGPITETVDAGNDIATAFIVPAGTTLINGNLGPPTMVFGSDVDLYRFNVTTTGTFTIQANEVTAALDMNLIVFNAAGQGLAGDDDNTSFGTPIVPLGTGFDSLLTLMLTAGDYFVAVGDNNMAAFETFADFLVGNGAVDFIDNDFGILGSPTAETLGLVGAEFGPGSIEDEGDYILYFSAATGTTQAAVPEPATATLALLAAGLLMLRRKALHSVA